MRQPYTGVICKAGEVRTTKHVVAKAYPLKQYRIGNGGNRIPGIVCAVNRKAIVHHEQTQRTTHDGGAKATKDRESQIVFICSMWSYQW